MVRSITALEQLVAAGPVMMFRGDAADGRLTFVTPNLETVLGYRPDEALASGIREVSDGHHPEFSLEYVGHASSEGRWFVARVTRFAGDGPARIVVAHEDVTALKRAEARLRQSNAQLTDWAHELERRNEDVLRLSEMGDLLQVCQTAEEAYTVIAEYVRRLFPVEAGALFVLSPSGQVAAPVTVWGAAPAGAQGFARDHCWALRRGRLYATQDVRTGLPCRHAAGLLAWRSLCVPLMALGEALGVLHIQTAVSGEGRLCRFPDYAERLAQMLADKVRLALANLRLHEHLRSQAIRDPLTGLYNRRYMEESLDRELHRAAARGLPLSVVMLDFDYFKYYNDALGHLAGDILLQQLGDLMQMDARAEDIACRYGGDEFVLILPEASRDGARARAEWLREAVIGLTVRLQGGQSHDVTISAGIAEFPIDGATAHALLRAADAALYRAKAAGRNQVAADTEFC